MHVFVLLERVAGCCLCASICIKVLITTCCGFITVTLCVLLWDLAWEHEAGVVFFSTGSRFGHSYFLQQPVKVRITWGHFIHVPLEYPCWAPAGSSPVPVVPGIPRQHSGLDHNDGSSSSCTSGSRRCEEVVCSADLVPQGAQSLHEKMESWLCPATSLTAVLGHWPSSLT